MWLNLALNSGVRPLHTGENVAKRILRKIALDIRRLEQHPVSGIGVAVLLILLKMNNIPISYTQQELIDMGLETAEGIMKEKDILDWIENHINE